MKKLLFCVFLSSQILAQNNVDSLLIRANTYYEVGDYQSAYNIYIALTKADSTNLILKEKTASAAYRLGDLPSAKTIYLQIAESDSTRISVLSSLANIYEYEKNTPKAIKYFSTLASVQPETPTYQRKVAEQYQKAGLKRIAQVHYLNALRINEKDVFSIKGLSELYLSDSRFTITDSLLHLGLKRDSSNISLNLLIATSKYRQKAYDSTAYYMEYIKGELDFRPHHNKMLGYAYVQIDSFDQAIHYLTQAINDPGTKEYAHYYLGVAYEKQKNNEFALYHFKEAIQAGISKDIDLYHRNTARLYKGDNNLKEAISHYQDAYKYGKDPLLLFYLAMASDRYYKDKNIARRYYERFQESGYQHKEYQEYASYRARELREWSHQNIKK